MLSKLKVRAWLLPLALLLAGPANGQEDEDLYGRKVHPKDAVALGADSGLSGFQSMVDARSPEAASDVGESVSSPLPLRVGASFYAERHERDFRGGQRLDLREERFGGAVRLGLTFPAAFTKLAIPFELGVGVRAFEEGRRREVLRPAGLGSLGSGSRFRGQENGGSTLTGALKIQLPTGVDAVAIAPYAMGEVSPGDNDLDPGAVGEYGLAVTLSPGLANVFAFHAGVAGVHREHGVSALRYRAGVSVSIHPPGRLFLLRLHLYGEGLEYEGADTSDIDMRFGAELIFARRVVFFAGFTHRFVHSGFRSKEDRLALQQIAQRHPSLSPTPSLNERHTDAGYQAFSVGLSLIF